MSNEIIVVDGYGIADETNCSALDRFRIEMLK